MMGRPTGRPRGIRAILTRRRRSVALATILAATLLLPAAAVAAGTAVDDAYSVAEDATLAVSAAEGVLANDLPADANLSVQRGDDPEHGSLSLNLNSGLFTYTPDPNFHGIDTFTYRNRDGTADPSNEATVTITVTSVNDAPVANDDPGLDCPTFSGGFPIPEDWGEFVFGGSGECSIGYNDFDPDGDAIVDWEVVDEAAHGETTMLGDGWLSYTADPHFSTPEGDEPSDFFTYRVSDGTDWSEPARMNLWLAPVNDAPTFTPGPSLVIVGENSGAYSAAWATEVEPGPGWEDHQTVSFEVTTNSPQVFAVQPAIAADGTLTFTPATDAVWLAEVTVVAKDDGGLESYIGVDIDPDDTSDAVTFDLAITENSAPVASPDTLVALEDGGTVSIDPRTDDTDDDDDPLTIVGVSATTHGKGTVGFTATSVRYTPTANATGGDGFTYTVSDGRGGTDEALVAVSITPVNDPPNAANDAFTVAAGSGANALTVRANDSILPDTGETLAISAITQPPNGVVAITGGGTGLTYAPKALFRGTDSFTYTISDGHGGTDSATVSVSVVDHAPPTVALPSTAMRTGVSLGASSVSARVTWSASDVGSGIRSYQLQQSVNGAAFTTIPLTSSTATSAIRSLTVGTGYVFRVRATDGAGNVSAWRTATVIRPALYQEATSLATYSGTWATSLQSSASGGKTRYATRTTSSVTFRFNGRDVALVAPRFTSSGRVRIYVDGVLVTTVDLDTATSAARQVVFQRHFAALGAHTLKLQVYGDGRVDADAFVVLR